MGQKRTGGTWDGRGHSQDLPSSPEDGTLQPSLCHTELWGKGTGLAPEGHQADVPKGTLKTPGHCWQDVAMPRKAPLPGTKNSLVLFLLQRESGGRWSQAAAHPLCLWESHCPQGQAEQHRHLSLWGGDTAEHQHFVLPDPPGTTGLGAGTGTITAGSAVSYLFQVTGTHGAQHFQGYSVVSEDWHVLLSRELQQQGHQLLLQTLLLQNMQ